MRLAVALVLLAFAPLALAQPQVLNPVVGPFEGIYIVAGRIVDAAGKPAANADVVIDVEQEGVIAKPLVAKSECYGTFVAYFSIREVRADGKLHITVRDPFGNESGRTTVALDPFFRRSDVNVRLDGAYPGGCEEALDLWPHRVTVTGRVVNRTEPYEKGGAPLDAEPYRGQIRLRFWDSPIHFYCPPSAHDPAACDANSGQLDERGDFRYSWIIDEPLTLRDAKVEIILEENTTRERSYNFTVDPVFHLATARIEATGRGAPQPSPGPGVALVAVAAALAVLVARRR